VPPVTASRADRSDGIPIGELSRLTGVNIETIRYYEKIKMVHHPRTEGGRRVYGPTEIRVLAFIRRGRELGFGLEDIRALLAWERRGTRPAGMCARLLHTILMISAPRSLTFGSSKGCSRKQSHSVPEATRQIAPS
jgi:DNA-binding transcriptional MerR regulator